MAIAVVANVGKSTPGTSGAVDTSGADLLVMLATSTGVRPTPSDSKSNEWSFVSQRTFNVNTSAFLFVAYNPTVGSGHTFTVASGVFSSFAVIALSNTNDFAVSALTSGAGNASVASQQPGSLTPSVDNCIVIAALAYRTTTAVSINGGFTITDQFPFSAGVAIGSALAYLIQTTAAPANPSFSWTGNTACVTIEMVIQSDTAPAGSSVATAYPFGG